MKKYILFCLLTSLFSCQQQKIQHIQGLAQGSTYTITYIGEENTISKKSIDSIIRVIDLSMSTYLETSTISKFNRGEKVKIDPHFQKVFTASKQIFKESNGYFDPSIGTLINAWGFGKKQQTEIPSQQKIDSLLRLVGLDKISENNFYLNTKTKGIELNFNAIAQGYTCDVIADFLRQKKITNFIAEVGGEMTISGKNILKNKKWVIGIDNPLQKEGTPREVIETLELSNCGLATSGNYRKIRIDSITGKKYVHTLNPKTGFPEKSDILSASVIAPTAMEADGYATTFMALGLEKSKKLLKKNKHLKVLFLYADSTNSEKIRTYKN